MKVRRGAWLVMLLSFSSPLFAQTEVWLGVTKYRTFRIPVVVEPFEGDPELALTLGETVSRDLSISGFFEIVAPGSPDTVRARAVVGGRVLLSEGFLEGIIDQAPGRERISSSRYNMAGTGPRDAAHRFSDDIIFYLTGEFGISRSRIAFVRSTGERSDLHVIDWDGANVRRLVSNGSINITPEWAPRGGILLYTSYVEGDANLYWADVETAEGGPVISAPGVISAPAWSPDGRRIVFMMTRQGNAELYVMNRDATGLKRLTHHGGIDTEPTWAPNGRQIAFTSDRSGRPQLYRMNDDGSDVVRLTFSGEYNASPKWSPEGGRIVYVSREEGGFQIRVLDLADQESYLLTFQSGNNEDPEWSPDGRHIVFSSTRTGRRRLYVMQADGSNVRLLLSGEGEDYSPSWSPRP